MTEMAGPVSMLRASRQLPPVPLVGIGPRMGRGLQGSAPSVVAATAPVAESPAPAPAPGAPAPLHHLRWTIAEGSVHHREAARACLRRALLLWPRLDRSRLARTGGDPWRIARLVAGRTPRGLDEIVAMLTHTIQACPVVPARAHRPLPEGTPLIPRR